MPDKAEQREFSVSGIEVRAAEGDKPAVLTGYFIEWGKRSDPIYGYFVENFAKGAFNNLHGDIRALWQHDTSLVMGRSTNNTLSLFEDDRGCKFEIQPPNTTWANDAVESIRRGDVSAMSFGFITKKEQWDESDPNMPVRTILDAQLMEISPVTFPAYPQTSVSARSARETFDSFSEQKRSLGNTARSISVKHQLDKLDLLSKEA